jgi:hypothetical protein
MGKEKGPEWNEVTILKEPEKAGGNFQVKCGHCQLVFWGGATRIRGHFLGQVASGVKKCTKCPEALRKQLQQSDLERKEQETHKRKVQDLDEAADALPHGPSKKQSTLKAAFGKQDKSNVDDLWGRCFFGNGLSFRLIDDAYFKAAVQATADFGENYKLPTSKALRTTLLDKEKDRLVKELDSYMASARGSKATITSDGWSDTRNRHLLNILMVTPKGEKFVRSVDTSGETKDADFIAEVVGAAIERVGADIVVHVCMDSAAVCKSAGRKLEARFPHVTFTPCSPHCLDLLLEDMGKLDWVSSVVDEARTALKFITNHHKSLALFRSLSNLELLKPGETRFATNFIMLERMQEVKVALQQLVVGDAWREWNEKSSHEMEGEEVHDILTSAAFWKGIKEVLAVSESIVCLLRQCDKGIPIVGKVYYAMFLIGEELRALREGTSEEHPALRLSAARQKPCSSWRAFEIRKVCLADSAFTRR